MLSHNAFFPYGENFQLRPDLEVNYKQVLDIIEPLITPERQERIRQVVRERCFSVSVVLEGIYDRGNSSAVMRTAEGLGFQRFDVIETFDKFKAANRVTSGAEKWLHINKWSSTKDCLTALKNSGHQILATALRPNSIPLDVIDFTKPTALILGNEKDGVSEEAMQMADHCVIVPMTGFVQSFNISVAGAISLYHIYRDRLNRTGTNADVTLVQQEILKALYYLKTLDSAPDILKSHLGSKSSEQGEA